MVTSHRDQFRKHLEQQGKLRNTIRSYMNDITQFSSWCRETFGEEPALSSITPTDIKDFRTFLLTRKTAAASVNRKLTALRQYFGYFHGLGLISTNPVDAVSGVHASVQTPAFLTRRDALLLLRTVEQSNRFMDTAIVLLLLHAGLRSGEICALTVGDLHLSPRSSRLFIRGQKERKMRFVHLSTRAHLALSTYCKRFRIPVYAKKMRDQPLFSQASGNPLTQQAIDHIVKRVGRQAGLDAVTPSMLRNTFAVQALMNKTSLEEVMRVMGFATVKNLVALQEALRAEHKAA